ncbi:MAG: hypothetical protein KAH57_11510 [Thermoplasmata archaeon]|nr:hypothetical protein [Thermoplasmata archaeon]
MGTLYLSSRTEFIRAVDLDTGRTILLIGLPDEMVKWLDIGLPRNTPSVRGPHDMEGRAFDIVIWWIERGGYDQKGVERVRELLTAQGEFWAILPREGDLIDEFIGSMVLDVNKSIHPLMMTQERDMVPIWVPEAHDR